MSLSYLISGYRPINADELFNFRHASARNVIEGLFGVLKRRFRILVYPAEISMEYQARIPAAHSLLYKIFRRYSEAENRQLEVLPLSQIPGVG